MLGAGSGPDEAVLSQGTFVRELIKLISKEPDIDGYRVKRGEPIKENEKLVFNQYFRKGDYESIMLILRNAFNAVSKVWPNEWEDTKKYVILKTVGFEAIMQSLGSIIDIGKKDRNLTEEFFVEYFKKVKELLDREGVVLDSETFKSQYNGVTKLKKYLLLS